MRTLSTTRLLSVPLITGLFGCIATQLNAQVTYSASENYGVLGTLLGQGNTAVNDILDGEDQDNELRNNSCAPTSVANGLSYLAAVNPGLFTTSPNNYTAVNALQSQFGTTDDGTPVIDMYYGTQAYLSPNSTEDNNVPTQPVGVGLDFAPTPAGLAQVLKANDAVQLGILWGSVENPIVNGSDYAPEDGGHAVSLDAVNITGGTGTMGIVDPWGVGVYDSDTDTYNASSTGVQVNGITINTVTLAAGPAGPDFNDYLPAGTYLEGTYPVDSPLGDYPFDPNANPNSALAGDNTPNGTFLILVDQVESVPEPGSFLISTLATAGVTGLMLINRRKKIVA